MNIFSATFINRSYAVLSAIGFLYALGIGLQVRGENRALMNDGLRSAQRVGHEAQTRIANTLRHATGTIDKESRNLFENGQDNTEQFLAPIRNIMYSDPGFARAFTLYKTTHHCSRHAQEKNCQTKG